MDAGFLRDNDWYFGGGTAIALSLGEYRESVDIDFLCSSRSGYRALYERTTNRAIGPIDSSLYGFVREPRRDRDRVRAVLRVEDVPIKVEFVLEGRIALSPSTRTTGGVPTLSETDLFAEKLLATADRGLDKATFGRDLIDLAFMEMHWGPIPEDAWRKLFEAYGGSALRDIKAAATLLSDSSYLRRCLEVLKMDVSAGPDIKASLQRLFSPERDIVMAPLPHPRR